MDERRLDEDLNAMAKRPRPPLPDDFHARVWGKIQAREAPAAAGRLPWLRALRAAWASPPWAAAALGLALLAGWALGRLTARPEGPAAEARLAGSAVTGEVIDLACYFDDGSSGPAHAACARRCIQSGLPVGLKAQDGTVYVLIGEPVPPSPQAGPRHESLNAQLAPYAAQVVTVSGTRVRKAGLQVIENARLLRAEARAGAPAARRCGAGGLKGERAASSPAREGGPAPKGPPAA
jgi:hypothetical protein